MNDNELNEPKGGILSDPMDRRSALKKAAAAGAIAWTAPMILSSTAHAVNTGNGVCTPRCAVANFGAQFSTRDACANELATLQNIVGTGNKLAIIRAVPDASSGTCPCSALPPTVVVSVLNVTEFSKNNGAAVGCDPFEASPSNLQVKPYPGKPNEFIVFKSGAIGDGWYTANGPICVAIGCPDKIGGDIVYRSCSFFICFNYSPSKSICTIAETIETRSTTAGTCTVGCVPCPV